MILEQTIEKLAGLKLRGMVSALEQWRKSGMKDLEPADLLGLLVDAEWTARENRRLTQRLREAHFPMAATVEALDYQHPRGLSKQKLLELMSSRWIHAHQNIIITGKTGLGKTYLPCALGNKACRDGYRALYTRAPNLFGTLYRARADGTYPRVLQRLSRTHVLIIDDLGTGPLEPQERRDLREVLEDRYGVSSTVITSQLDPKHWHSFIGDETLADAICDRLVHNAHTFKLDGESMRKKYGLRGPKSENGKEE
jgi:DNA replication protein DnaC